MNNHSFSSDSYKSEPKIGPFYIAASNFDFEQLLNLLYKMAISRSALTLLCVLSCMLAQTQAGWNQITGGLKHISAATSYVWGVNSADQIFICTKPCTGSNWVHIPGYLVQLDVDNYEVWGVNSANTIYKRPIDGSGAWQNIPGALKHVSASGNGYIWGVNDAGSVYKCRKPCTGQWELVDGSLKQVDGGNAYVYGVSCIDDIYARPVDGSGSWRQIPGKLKHITASGKSDLFGVNAPLRHRGSM